MATNKASLVIVESPSKAKTISRFLGKGYRVEASYGHVRDLPESAKDIPPSKRGLAWARLGVDVEHGFEPLYVIPKDKAKHVKRLKEAVKGADSLLLATDEDREGESISWHVLEVLSPPKSMDVKRIVFHEVTKEAIDEALRSPRRLDEHLVRSQEARRILDRLYGYSLSPLLWKRVAKGLSAGRVQSVAVRLIVERERERIRFVPASYWDVEAELRSEDGDFKARLIRVGDRRLADGKSFDALTGKLKDTDRLVLDEAEARRLAEAAAVARPWTVSSLQVSPGSQSPSPPFITSTLQQEANRKLKFPTGKTMRIAQQLYEGVDLDGERVGLITYMRTDSTHLAERAIADARRMIEESYGSEYLPRSPIRYKTKAAHAQEAHEAIRPTDIRRRPQEVKEFLDDDQYRLYELIWKRTIASQMVPARFERTNVEVTVEIDGAPITFAAAGRRILFPGFLRAYVEGSDDPEAELGDKETILPKLTKGQPVEPLWVRADGHTTKPPFRYTEASLVKRLEEEGIGRPSTYATIITTIQDRGYIFKRGNELVPTFTAFCVTEFLERHFADLVDVHFTAEMEEELDDVAEGKRKWVDAVAAFYFGAGDRKGLTSRIEQVAPGFPSVTIGKDPHTGEPLVVKIGRYGPYVQRGEGGEGNYVSLSDKMPPDELTVDRALALLDGKVGQQEAVATDTASGRDILVKTGRYGDYIEVAAENDEKPKRVTLPKELRAQDVTPEIARDLASLPRSLGKHPETGKEIVAGIGRYGPFLRHGDEYRSLDNWRQACEVTLSEAVHILAQPKFTRKRGGKKSFEVLKDFGELPGANGHVRVLNGRYGPYVTDGKVNATLPKGVAPAALTPEEAIELLERKRR